MRLRKTTVLALLLPMGLVGLPAPAIVAQQTADQGGGSATAVSGAVLSGVVLSGVVVDTHGEPIRGARVTGISGQTLGYTSDSGKFQVGVSSAPTGKTPSAGKNLVRIEANGFAPATVAIEPAAPLRIVLTVAAGAESVEVTAYRTPLATEDSPASTRNLTSHDLDEAASPALDNKLRLVPGVELFRRSSSLVANPTSQGLSLRGLGSTAASRTLVVSNDVPLNDPYGGWIHWNEPPELTVRSIEVVRGGASDLYGSSAIGGVVNLLAVRPTRNSATLLSSYGAENTLDEQVLGSAEQGGAGQRQWGILTAAGILRTDGYTLIAPALRGPVDVPSNVHSQNGVLEADHKLPDESGMAGSRPGSSWLSGARVFVRGSGFNEARSNGTRLQTNATRLWRFASGADLPTPAIKDQNGALAIRLYGSEEHYRQSFSAILPGRLAENQTRFERTPAQELGAVAYWTQPLSAGLLVVAGADTHDVRATDTEQSIANGAPAALVDTTARQRQTGAYGEALWTPKAWTLSAGGRVDHFTNFDVWQSNSGAPDPNPAALPNLAETVFDPRVGVARHLLPRLVPNLVYSASAFRAYRAPTQNELYRTGQVGQETTLPNGLLKSERATGWETGLQMSAGQTAVRASYFWTQVNRPITALTLSTTPTQILDKRENLGQIESRGVSFDVETRPLAGVVLSGGYQYADATVTQFAPSPALVGNWIPQVARNTATLQARISRNHYGALSLQGRLSGRQFDDAANQFMLHGYFRLDAYASHDFGRHVEFFAAGENLLDRTIEVGRTPTLTLGTPATARAGLRIHWGE